MFFSPWSIYFLSSSSNLSHISKHDNPELTATDFCWYCFQLLLETKDLLILSSSGCIDLLVLPWLASKGYGLPLTKPLSWVKHAYIPRYLFEDRTVGGGQIQLLLTFVEYRQQNLFCWMSVEYLFTYFYVFFAWKFFSQKLFFLVQGVSMYSSLKRIAIPKVSMLI